jgi:heptosyltransferase I
MKRGSVSNRFFDRNVGIPVLFAMSRFSWPHARPGSFNRIGILAPPALGDTILNSGALQDVRSEYPKAHLIYFSTPNNSPIVSYLPGIDELVNIRLTSPLSCIRKIRSKKLDLLIDFNPWTRLTAFYSAMSGATYRVGFRSENQHRHWLYDLAVPHSSARHEVDNYRALVRALGIDSYAEPKLRAVRTVPPEIAENGRTIVFHPWASGDRHALREWPEENWVNLAQQLQVSDAQFLVTGSPAQLEQSQELCDLLRNAGIPARPFKGSKGLDSLCGLLMNADLVVSVNTGVMHLAAVLGAPTIGLNGPNSSHRWGPVGPRVASVEPHGGKDGYLNFGFEFAGHLKDCMQRTRVEDVVEAAYDLVPDLFPVYALARRFSESRPPALVQLKADRQGASVAFRKKIS